MPKIAGHYDCQEPRDAPDTFDRFERDDAEPRDRDGGSAERGQPFTEDEVDAYLDGGGAITICPPPVQPEPKSPGLTKAQIAWAEDFHPLVFIWDAVDACRRHLDIIRPTRPQNALRRLRAREIVKGVLQGWIFADVAVELCLDKGFLSRKVTEIYAEYPELERGLIFVNLLNNQAKRHKQSTPWGFQLQGGAENSDGARGSTSDPFSPYNPGHVKLAELYHRAFPQPRSNYGTMVAKYFDEAPSKGIQRIEHIQRDHWGYELGTDDYRAKIAGHENNARQRTAVYQWRRLCQFAGLRDNEPAGPEHEWLLKLVAEDFFHTEAQRRMTSRVAIEPMELPASFYDAPWINPGYLVPTDAVDPQPRFKAPYVPFVNECKPGKSRKIHPSKYPAKANSYRGKGLRARRFAKQVHNATAYGPDANRQFLDITGVKEPNPGWTSADVSIRPMVRNGEKWKRGRIGTRCMPINSFLSSLF